MKTKILSILICFATAGIMASCDLGSDTFGKDHPIPEGVNYSIPMPENMSEPDVDSLSEDSYLRLWNSIQGGVYEYSFYYPSLPDGEVFLSCFEVSENVELSPTRLPEASKVEVKDHTSFGQIANRQRFTIYEGDWEDYYAARIEVWHKDAATGKKTKLLDEVYRVEGWMR